MKDSKDCKTLDAFPTKKRGRPTTGLAKSALERKKISIAKRLSDFENAYVTDYKTCSVAYLMDYLAFLISRKMSVPARLVANELARRAT